MTSFGLLQSVALWLGNAGLLSGMDVKYYRFVDTDPKGNTNFVLFRIAGPGGVRTSKVQAVDIKLIVVGRESEIEATNDKADAIFAKFGEVDAPATVIKIEPQAVVMGPQFLDNARCAFEINARCFVDSM